MKKRAFFIANALMPLLLGALIYGIFSPEVWFVRRLDRLLGRPEREVFQGSPVLQLVRNYVPDFLWAYSLTACLFLIFDTAERGKVLFVSLVFAALLELMQLFPGVPGTFDPLDLLVQCAAELISAFIVHKVSGK